MTSLIPIAIFSGKVVLLGAILWIQLYFLRQAPAKLRSRLCAAALAVVPMLGALQVLMPNWRHAAVINVPVVTFRADSVATADYSGTWANWVLWCWAAGAAVMMFRIVAGRIALAAARRKSIPLAIPLEIDGGLEVRTADVGTPILVGLTHPAILVPFSFSEWSETEREMVLIHEVNHYRHGDHWTILLAQLVRASLWFHPVAWMLASRLSREQELACDEAVVAAGHVADQYAAFLLDRIRALPSSDLLPCAMAGSGAGSVKQRFARLLDPRPLRTRKGWVAASLALLAAFVFATMAVTPIWSQAEKKPEQRTDNSKLVTTPTVVSLDPQTGEIKALFQQAGPGGARKQAVPAVPVAAQDKKTYRVADGIVPPKVLRKTDPTYDQSAKEEKIQGTVLLKIVVTTEGKAADIEVVRGLDPRLDQKATDAVTEWEFQPATKDGQPVNCWATVEVNFRMI